MNEESYVIADIDGLRELSPLMLKLDGVPCPKPSITFMCDADTWFLKIINNRFEFNEEQFPDMAPSDFAREFVRLLKLTKLIQDYELPPL